jgi:GNAT superfamily N-acetyltransferase
MPNLASLANLPENYPRALDREVSLSSGELVHLRPIYPGDAERLVAFHARLSSDSVYRRYFSFHPELSDNEVAWLTTVDYVDRLALIVEDDDQLLAVGRYDRVPGTDEAEVAFLVADEYQHRGMGMLLLHHLATAARRQGITTFTAETQANNRDMMGVFEGSGFDVSASLDAEIISVRFRIAPYDATQDPRVDADA